MAGSAFGIIVQVEKEVATRFQQLERTVALTRMINLQQKWTRLCFWPKLPYDPRHPTNGSITAEIIHDQRDHLGVNFILRADGHRHEFFGVISRARGLSEGQSRRLVDLWLRLESGEELTAFDTFQETFPWLARQGDANTVLEQAGRSALQAAQLAAKEELAARKPGKTQAAHAQAENPDEDSDESLEMSADDIWEQISKQGG